MPSDHSYGLVHLRELDDSAEAGGFGEALEARFARDALGAERIGVSLQRVKPGTRAPFGHRHAQDEEVYVIVAGSGRALLEGETVELKAWDALHVPASTSRAFEAGDDGLEYLAFGSHTEGDRGEILQPEWDQASGT
jgi:uncharacterized cupin superfamily protein